MKLLNIVLILTLLSPFAAAQDPNKAGTTAAQFLKIGIGARASGMGGATAALSDDPYAMYWNPAGLTGVYKLTATAAYTDWFVDIQHQYFGVVFPLSENMKVGVSTTILSMDEMEITTEQNPEGTGEFFEASDAAVGLSFAVRMVNFFSFGINVKYITQSLYNETASAVAFDLGTVLSTGYQGIKIGMCFSNFGSKMQLDGRDLQKTYDPNPNNASNTGVISKLETEEWDLPINFRVGVGWDIMGTGDVMIHNPVHTVKFAVDANHPNDALENAVVGLEYGWQDLIFFRGGYHFNDDLRSWSAGMGLNYSASSAIALGMDYSISDFDKLGTIQRVSLNVGF